MSDALKVSSDVFFYHLGEQADRKSTPIQHWARKLGFGRLTGIDLPGELPGLVPDSDWRDKGFAAYEKCRKKAGLGYQTQAALYKCGGIDKTWTTGDSVNLAVGQGDLQATPLQVAVAYSALANGGTIVTPHLGKAIEDGNGVPIQELPAKPKKKVKIDAHDRAGRARRPAPRRQRRRAAPRPTSSRASRTRSTARPAPSSASPTRIRRGTPASSRTAASRSWSS